MLNVFTCPIASHRKHNATTTNCANSLALSLSPCSGWKIDGLVGAPFSIAKRPRQKLKKIIREQSWPPCLCWLMLARKIILVSLHKIGNLWSISCKIYAKKMPMPLSWILIDVKIKHVHVECVHLSRCITSKTQCYDHKLCKQFGTVTLSMLWLKNRWPCRRSVFYSEATSPKHQKMNQRTKLAPMLVLTDARSKNYSGFLA